MDMTSAILNVIDLPVHVENYDNQYSINISLKKAERLIIIGQSDSGKTSLAELISGIHKTDRSRIYIDNSDITCLTPLAKAEKIAFVPTDPMIVFSGITRTLRKEIELSFALIGQKLNHDKIEKTLHDLDLNHLAERDPFTLSGGEKVRAALALVLIKNPILLVLDDIFGQIDPLSEMRIMKHLEVLMKNFDLSIIEFRSVGPNYITEENVKWIFLTTQGAIQGTLKECWARVIEEKPDLLPPLLRTAASLKKKFNDLFIEYPNNIDEFIQELKANKIWLDTNRVPLNKIVKYKNEIAINNLTYSYPGSHSFRLGPISTIINGGEVTAILGPNGAGKTTLLKCIGKLIDTWSGSIKIGDNGPFRSTPLHIWARSVLFCFQNPDDQLYLPTVKDELKETCKRIKEHAFPVDDAVDRIIKELDLTSYINLSPLIVPHPVRRLVSLASAFVAAPSVLVLDEPTASLDIMSKKRLANVIQQFKNTGGIIIMTSHDYNFVSEVSDNIIIMNCGLINSKGRKDSGFNEWPTSARPIIPELANLLGQHGIWKEMELLMMLSQNKKNI
jgi:energy-coupling factor transport system ATP-binding protein